MKKFLLKIVLFLCFLISGAYILDYYISSGLRTMHDYRFQSWNEIQSGKINADLVIMGNSRGLSHFVPSVIDSVTGLKSYNISIGGHPFNVEYDKYRFYRAHNIKPKVLVMNVDFLTFTSPAILGHEREQVFPYVKDDTLRSILPSLGFKNTELHLPLIRYFGYQKVIKDGLLQSLGFRQFKNRISEKGFLAEEGQWNSNGLNVMKRIDWHFDSLVQKRFEIFLKKCKEENVKVVLVYSPLFILAKKKLEHPQLLDAYFSKVADEYSAEYYDYSQLDMCKDSDNFVVSIHLNKINAMHFSHIFAEELKKSLKKEMCIRTK